MRSLSTALLNAELLQRDPAEFSVDQCNAALVEAAKLQCWLDSRVGLVLRAIDIGSSDLLAASDALVEATGVSCRSAKAEVLLARQLGELRVSAQALAAGEINKEHAVKIAKMFKRSKQDRKDRLRSDEAGLIAAAKSQTPEEFGEALSDWERAVSHDEGLGDDVRRRQGRSVKLFDGGDNMTVMSGRLDAESSQIVASAFDQIIAEMWRAENRKSEEDHLPASESKSGIRHADALVEMARRALNVTPQVARKTRQGVGVLIDYHTLTSGLHDHSVCETGAGVPIAAATARRIACDAGIVPIVLSGSGQPLDVGRAKRLATAGQRVALRAVHSTCAAKGCDMPFAWCEIHHIVAFEFFGPTDLNNLVPLCSRHHHLIHDGGWELFRDPLNPINVTFTRADEQHVALSRQGERHREHREKTRYRRRKAEQPTLI